MERGYWELFWRTGLPVAWLLSRRSLPEAAAAFARRRHAPPERSLPPEAAMT